MDLEQKFLSELQFHFEMEETFLDKMRSCDARLGLRIATHIDNLNITNVPIKDDWQIFGGVVVFQDEPHFFAVQLYRDCYSIVILDDILTISSDQYLDLYNLNKIISHGTDTSKSKTSNKQKATA